jgi:hypothetical protein
MKSGVHPTAVLNALEQDDDLVRQLRSRLDGASPEQLMHIAHGIHVCRGTSVEDVARQLDITIPSER